MKSLSTPNLRYIEYHKISRVTCICLEARYKYFILFSKRLESNFSEAATNGEASGDMGGGQVPLLHFCQDGA